MCRLAGSIPPVRISCRKLRIEAGAGGAPAFEAAESELPVADGGRMIHLLPHYLFNKVGLVYQMWFGAAS